MSETEQLVEQVNASYRRFWENRGVTTRLAMAQTPYAIRGLNPYEAWNIPPSDLHPQELIYRACSRKDRFNKLDRWQESQDHQEAEQSAVYQL